MTPLRLDSHIDTLHRLSKAEKPDYDLDKLRPDLDFDVPRAMFGGMNACFFAIFVRQTDPQAASRRFNKLMDILWHILDENEFLSFGIRPFDIRADINAGQISVSIGLENACMIENLNILEELKYQGIRYITLCHNKTNHICDSATDIPAHGGLSGFGKKMVQEMNKLGLMIDISHMSDEATEQVLESSNFPVIASHSNSYEVCPNARNLNDDLLTEIAKNGGVVQVSALSKCVGVPHNIERVVDHIDHIVRQIGINHVGIGSDFDGGGGVKGFDDVHHGKALTEALRKRGYAGDDIDKIWGLNFMRVYTDNYYLTNRKSY
jgi:membrane dipeptidase